MSASAEFPAPGPLEVEFVASVPPARLAFRLTPPTVRALVPSGTPGTYLLLRGDVPLYVGRSDTCLQSRLVNHNHLSAATHVLWEPAREAWTAFCLEAWWWHRHKNTLINKIHPARPIGRGPCPFCDDQINPGLVEVTYKHNHQ